MENENIKKGILFGIIGVVLISLQPVIANSRPSEIDAFIFAAITALFQAIIFFPLYFIERKRLRLKRENFPEMQDEIENFLRGWKKKQNIRLLSIIGVTFSIVPVMLFIGYELAGAINSSLLLKSEVIFALLFGYLILHEKVSKMQLIFSGVLFIGLFIAITQLSFSIEINSQVILGALILLIACALFTFIHTLTKTAFDRKELFPIQVVFIRSLLSGCILMIFYITIFPVENLLMIFEPDKFLYFLLMALVYGGSLAFWYKTLTYIGIGKASVINSLTPIISAFFAFIILGDIITLYYIIGTIIVIISILMVVRERKQ